jgi:penicillin-binding protein 2
LQRRLPVLSALVVASFVLLAGRLWVLQILEGERYSVRSADNFIKELEVPALRGRIVDRNHVVLAENRPSFDVYVTPRFYTEGAHAALVDLLQLPPEKAADVAARALSAKGLARYRAVRVVRDIGRDRAALVEMQRDRLVGVQVEIAAERSYPMGALAGHLLGYMGQVTPTELNERRAFGYGPGDTIGRSGLERRWEPYLRGRSGLDRVVVDARGQRKSGTEAEELLAELPANLRPAEDSDEPPPQDGRSSPEEAAALRVQPRPGVDLVLTLDARLQRAAEEAFAAQPSGAAVAVEVDTGRLLVLLSKPALDPNMLSGRITLEEEQRFNRDPLRPRIDKTIRENYFPGSTFKVVTAIAALQHNIVTPESRFFCPGTYQSGGRVFHCHGSHGSTDVHLAIAGSCNVYFWRIAERIDMDHVTELAFALGFGTPTGIALGGEVAGFVPTRQWYEQSGAGGFHRGFALNTVIGQGSVKATPLQLAMAYAAIANGGALYVPQIVLRLESTDGKVVAELPPLVRRRLSVEPGLLATVREGLRQVVRSPRGTGFGSRLPNIEVAGKTGTAQVGAVSKEVDPATLPPGVKWDPTQDHAWFAAYAPATAPKLAVVVLSEHGGFGAQAAAPIAMRIIQEYFAPEAPPSPPPGARVAGPGHPP